MFFIFLTMVLKIGMVKEPEKGLVTNFLVQPKSTSDVIIYLINNFLIYINK